MESQRIPASEPTPTSGSRGLAFKLAALGLVVVSALAGTGLARWLAPQPAGREAPPHPKAKLQLDAWPKPDLALFLTAQMHGYILPCGCSRPQIGGLERRYNLLQHIKEKGWQVLPLDLGDIAQKEGAAKLPNIQGIIKYQYSMRALKLMGYTGVGIGEYESSLPSMTAIGNILNDKVPPIILGNFDDPKNEWRSALEPHLSRWRIVEDPVSKTRVGVTSIISSGVAARIKDTDLKLTTSAASLDLITREMDRSQLNYRVLLFQGSLTRGLFAQGFQAEAVEVAKAYPQFDLVICQTEEEEPPANPTRVKHQNGRETLVLGIGHKGRYIGVLGLYRKGNDVESRWELVQMSEDFLTPAEKEADHPVVKLLENYTQELKDQNYLNKVPQIRHSAQVAIPGKNPTFVGSEKCKKCHEKAYDIWKESGHAHAFQTLTTATRPSNREYDPECIVCHTVGFGYESGYRDEKTTAHLKDVGCESCHGPCSDHIKNPLDATWYPVINPYRPGENETPEAKTKRLGRIDQFCQKCHDIDNDVNWGSIGFANKWKKIAHPTLDE